MARITVEDCMSLVKNRFELCVLAAYRAKEIYRGSPVTIKKEANDKNTVTALKEIADTGINVDSLRDSYILNQHKGGIHFDDVAEQDTQNIAAELMDSENPYVVETKTEDSEESYISVEDYGTDDEEEDFDK